MEARGFPEQLIGNEEEAGMRRTEQQRTLPVARCSASSVPMKELQRGHMFYLFFA